MAVRFHHILDCRAPLAMTPNLETHPSCRTRKRTRHAALANTRHREEHSDAAIHETPVIARSAATRRSMAVRFHPVLDCRASLAMTRRFTPNDVTLHSQ
jgi:hypothetical protein